MSTLVTNKIIDQRGNTMLQSGGAVRQIQQYTYNTVYENTTNNTEYDMPGVLGNGTASITPAFSNSRILFTAVLHCGSETTWRANFFKTFYKIGSGSWTLFNGGLSQATMYTNTNGLMISIKNEFLLPTLSTTSVVYFKITQIGHNNGGYLHLNQNNITNDASANNSVDSYCSITLKEITS